MKQKILFIKGCSNERANEIISLLKEKIFPEAEIDLVTNRPQLFLDDKRINSIYSGRGILEGFLTLTHLLKKQFEYVAIPLVKEGYFRYRFFAFLCFGRRILVFNDDLSYSYWNKVHFFCYPFKESIRDLVFLSFRLIFLLVSFIYLFISVGILFGKKGYYTWFDHRFQRED